MIQSKGLFHKKCLNKAFFILMLTACTCFHVELFSQPGFKMKPEDEALVNKYKKLFPKADFVSLNTTVEISFDITGKAKDEVEVEKIVKHELLALKEDISFTNYLYYDDHSEVSQLRARDTKGRGLDVYPVYKDYESDGIFYSDAKVCVYKLPAMNKGDHLEISYKYIYKDVRYFTSEYFNERFPVVEKKVSVIVPSWLDLGFSEFNFSALPIKKSEQKTSEGKTYIYSMKNMPEMKDERLSPNASRAYPHIFVQSKSFKSGGKEITLFKTTDDLYKFYKTLIKLVNNDPSSFTPLVNDLIKGKKTDEEKIQAIFYWVQDNIRYIAFENGIMGFKPDDAQNVYKNKYGDCKGMANLLCEMLKVAGFDAHLTWIGTRSKPYTYATPSIAVDNHMICSVLIKDKILYLDGTEKFIPLNDYAYRIQGREVMIENGDKCLMKTIPDAGSARNKQTTTLNLSIKDLLLNGNLKSVFDGEERTSIMYQYNNLRTDDREKALVRFISSNNPNLIISEASISDVKKREQAVEVKSGISISNNVVKVGSELYIDLDIEDEFASMVIDTVRFTGLDLGCSFVHEYKAELVIPTGYKADYLPEAFNFDSDNVSIQIIYKADQSKVTYTRTITVKNPMMARSLIPSWNVGIENLKKFYKDQLILVKS